MSISPINGMAKLQVAPFAGGFGGEQHRPFGLKAVNDSVFFGGGQATVINLAGDLAGP
jgi:hypothetical protein